jgi:hypothetical protein
MTRALVSLSRGKVQVSLRQHPFVLGMALYFGVLQAVGVSEILRVIPPENADRIVRASNQLLSAGLLASWVLSLAVRQEGDNEWRK